MNQTTWKEWLVALRHGDVPRQPLGLLAAGIAVSGLLLGLAPTDEFWIVALAIVLDLALFFGLGVLYVRNWWAAGGRMQRDERQLQRALGQLRTDHVQWEARVKQLRETLHSLQTEAKDLQRDIAGEKQKLKELQRDTHTRQTILTALETRLAPLRALGELHDQHAATQTRLQDATQTLTQNERRLAQAQTDLDQKKADRAQVETQLAQLRHALAQLDTELQQGKERLKVELRQEKERLETDLRLLRDEVAARDTEAQALSDDVRSLNFLKTEWAKAAPTPASAWGMRFSTDFIKSVLDNADKTVQGRILEAVLQVYREPLTPRGDTIKPLTHLKGQWRYRASNFRLIFAPNPQTRWVEFTSFEQRGDAYR
jgi:mRNA-degrading endonuclease RelE of RelBE toxin-antitoxin system